MSTARSTAPPPSSTPTWWAPRCCSLDALDYWRGLDGRAEARASASTTSPPTRCSARLGETGFFTEETPYDPRSPYSASKAASDHLVRAWRHTYGLPVLITNCSNNYGPYHFPEKLIPLMIIKALAGEALPVYGTGGQVRDWLYVEDHVRALMRGVRARASRARRYIIGGRSERRNLEVVRAHLRRARPAAPTAGGGSRRDADPPSSPTGRATISAMPSIPRKIERELGWRARDTLRRRHREDGALVSGQRGLVATDPARGATPASGWA